MKVRQIAAFLDCGALEVVYAREDEACYTVVFPGVEDGNLWARRF